MQPLLLAVTSRVADDALRATSRDDFADLAQKLKALGLSSDRHGRATRVLLDTFDWRLHRQGWLLEQVRPSEGPTRLRLRPVDSPVAVAELATDRLPRNAAQLPSGRLRDSVGDVAGARALLPTVTVATRWAHFRWLDDDAKTVGMVTLTEDTFDHSLDGPLENAHASENGGAAIDNLGLTVQVLPVRGYPDDFNRLAARVEQLLEGCGERQTTDPLVRAAAAIGLHPGQDPSAFDVELPADATAEAAVRLLLGRVHAVVMANEPRLREQLDEEFLHDYRVALRRGRAVLHLARGVIDEEERKWLDGELRWVGSITGPLRDLDVLFGELREHQLASPAKPEDLAPLFRQLERWRAAGWEELERTLQSYRYEQLLAGLSRMSSPDRAQSPAAGPRLLTAATRYPAGPMAAERLRKVHRALCREGRQARTNEDWHDLRKLAKRLRYQLEGVRSLSPAPAAEALEVLKDLQSALGEAQDRAAHAELLHAAGLALARQELISEEVALALLATGSLAEWHRRRGQRAVNAASKLFRRFDERMSRRRFARLWDSLHATGEPADDGDHLSGRLGAHPGDGKGDGDHRHSHGDDHDHVPDDDDVHHADRGGR